MRDVTPRQAEALGWIVRYISERGYPPSIREIGDGLDIGSLRGVTVHLDALERKGYVRRDPAIPRGLAVLKTLPIPSNTMNKTIIHRHPVPNVGVIFTGPSGPVTLGYQAARREFSLWFEAGRPITQDYIVVGAGTEEAPEGFSLVASTTLDDGFHTFHLLRRSS